MSDTIKRSDAINLCEKWRDRTNEHHDKNGWYIADTLLRAIKKLPSADRPRGEWIEVLFNEKIKYMVCSECGNRYAVDLIVPLEAWIDEKHRFCSLCGADMRKESE